MSLSIIRFGARFPFDVAADARSLLSGDIFVFEDGVEGGAQIGAGDGDAVARAAVVHLAAVDELSLGVE